MSDEEERLVVEASADAQKVIEAGTALSSYDKGVLILKMVEGMTGLELVDTKDLMEKALGVSAAGGGGVIAMPTGDVGAPVEEEQTEFDVHLVSFGEKKIQVIKAVRSLTSLGLKEAKALVDGAPCLVKDALPEDEANKYKTDLEAAGTTVEIK